MKLFITFFTTVIAWTAVADNNVTDTTVVAVPELDSVVISPDDPVLLALDNMLAASYFEANPLITDTSILNVEGFCPDSVPVYDDQYYATKLAELDAQTPFNLEFNKNVKGFIKLYTMKKRAFFKNIRAFPHVFSNV